MNIEQTQDKLVNSPICDSNACYESEFKTQDGVIKTWLCMTSGYTSNTTMTLDSEALKQTLELTAELIKDLRQDHVPPGGGEKLAWFPTVITMPEKGMIFPEPVKGTENEWLWTVVKSIPISFTISGFLPCADLFLPFLGLKSFFFLPSEPLIWPLHTFTALPIK